jgi:hypothetical protein
MSTQQYSFGSGSLFGRSNGNATPTPVRFGALQEVTLDFSFTTKQLYGGYQLPLAIGRGTGKITAKAKWAQFNAQAFNDLFFGNTTPPTTGETKTAVAEAQTVSASNIITATNNTTFIADQGVVKASDGSIYMRVASAPTGLQYTCNETTGVYTFNSSQNAVAVAVSYTYSDASNGKKITMTNQLLGNAPTFACVFTNTFNSQQQTITFPQCISSKLAMATKLEDFSIPEFDFEIFADASGTVGTFSLDN